ncbi:unnamed protein product [Mytilus coruscus]|uniref:Reverse transcriptase RNase H-like domain-containing protein n=1 Tax=Mytilus coruscus TaxID=42192 RepID=A0A6J8C0G0_MYTCO|nr:unnamed protein product [Mytilus coruscus]
MLSQPIRSTGKPEFPGGHQARPLRKVNGAKYREHAPFRHSGIVNTLTNTDNVPSFSENSSYSDNDTSEFYSDNETFSIAQTDSKFIYLHVKFHSVQVAALFDSGSSINIMSTSLYNSIPQACKSMIDVNNGDNIKLANDQNVQVKVKQCPTEQGDSIKCEYPENFEINPNLKDDQKIVLNHLLCDNKEDTIFQKKENECLSDRVRALNEFPPPQYVKQLRRALGVVTSIVDCASYLRGDRFTVECDHQALRSLFQNQFKGAIYDRWLAVLHQFNFDIKYKPTTDMQAPDALSRVENAPLLDVNAEESLNENDPHFPYEVKRSWKNFIC